MATTQYALNVYINTATFDPDSKPHSTPPGNFTGVTSWKLPWRWEWALYDDGTTGNTKGWYAAGNRVMQLPDSIGANPPAIGGQIFSIQIFDLNYSGSGYYSGCGISTYAVFFQFSYPPQTSAPTFLQPPPENGSTFTSNPNTLPVPEPSIVNTAYAEGQPNAGQFYQTTVTVASDCPGVQSNIPSNIGGNQWAALWSISAPLADPFPAFNITCDVSMWLEMQGTRSVYFYKDPEMQMDTSN